MEGSGGASPEAAGAPNASSRTWAALAHLLAFPLSWLTLGFGAWLVPLVIRRARKSDPFVARHATEALNFRIVLALVVTVLHLVAVLLLREVFPPQEPRTEQSTLLFVVLVLAIAHFALPILSVVSLFDLVVTGFASVRAYAGQPFRYPLVPRLIGG